MKYRLYVALLVLFFPLSVFSQFYITGNGLKKKQPKTAFQPLKYTGLDGNEVSGYGFVNPVDFKTLVFIKDKPKDSIVKDWKEIKVKSATIYRDTFKALTNKLLDLGLELNAEQKQRLLDKTTTLDDTLEVFFVRKVKGAVAHGMRQLIYKTDDLRFFKFLPTPLFTSPELVLVQTTDLPVYESDTYILGYRNEKIFLRTIKKNFKTCPKLIANAEKGNYFPESLEALSKLAEDYKNLCDSN